MSQAQPTIIKALIITYNEERNLEELISNLSFVDEIIIVDSLSTDKTEEIARKSSKIKFYKNDFKDYSNQRNYALNKAKNSWVLFLDADERIDEALKNEILEIVAKNKIDTAYYFNRRFYFDKKPIYFCGLQSDKNIRLFYNSEEVFYTGYVHEKLQNKSKTEVLKNTLIHYSYEDYDSYKSKMERYGVLKAHEKFDKGKRSSLFLTFIHPIYTFCNKFFIRLGILDGKKGAILCYLMAYSVYVRYIHLNKLQNKKTETT